MENTAKSRFLQLFSLRFVLIAALNIGTTCLVYYGARIFNLGRVYHCISVPADDLIPFAPGFILVYVLAFVQWGLNYLQLAHVDKTTCLRFAGALLLAKLVCGVVYLIYPTCMTCRPTPEGRDLLSALARLIFAVDTPPDNLFPSIHCLESWMCLRLTLRSKTLPRWVKWGCAAFTLLVFASVVLIRQHVLMDIPAGIAVGEVCLLLTTRMFKERKQNT